MNRTDLYFLLKKAVVDSEIVNYVVENKTHLDRWDFSGAFGFVVSVVTTIGKLDQRFRLHDLFYPYQCRIPASKER